MRRSSIALLFSTLFAIASVGCDSGGTTKSDDAGIDSSKPDSSTADAGDAGSDAGDAGADAGPTRGACPQGTDTTPSRSCYLASPTDDCFNTAANANADLDKYYLNRCAPNKTCSPVSVTIPAATWTPGTPLPQPQ